MIMISDLTMNNYTASANPSWMNADNYAQLLGNYKSKSLFDLVRGTLSK